MRPTATVPRGSTGFRPGMGNRRRLPVDATRAVGHSLPARLGTTTTRAAAATAMSAGSCGLRSRFVDGECTAAELTAVQLGNRLLRAFVGAHFNEREAPRAARHLI